MIIVYSEIFVPNADICYRKKKAAKEAHEPR